VAREVTSIDLGALSYFTQLLWPLIEGVSKYGAKKNVCSYRTVLLDSVYSENYANI
jgi:hypothetical protein